MGFRISEVSFPDQPAVDAYGDGGFRVNEAFHAGSLLLMPSGVSELAVERLEDLSRETLAEVHAGADSIDVLLIGTGARIARPALQVVAELEEAGVGVEFMDTGAACRTYNVLLSEGRRVGAALIAVA